MLALILLPFFVGFISFLTPTGPVTISIFKNSILGKYGKVIMILLGASVVQIFFCVFSLIVVSELISPKIVVATRILSAIVFFVLGIYLLLSKPKKSFNIINLRDLRKKDKWGAFLIGFSLTLLNPSIIFSWMAVTTLFISFKYITISNYIDIITFSLSGLIGIVAGSSLMIFLVHYYREVFSDKHIKKLLEFLGAMILLISFYFLYTAIYAI